MMIKLSLISSTPSRWESLLTSVEACTLHMGKPNDDSKGIGQFPLIALDLEGVRPIEVEALRQEFPTAILLGLGTPDDSQVLDRLIEHSAIGVVGSDADRIIQQAIVERAFTRYRTLRDWTQLHDKLLALIARLTRKEQEVFVKSCTYDSAPELANALGISARTIEAHRYNLTRKVDEGSFREWTLALRLALDELAEHGFRANDLLGQRKAPPRRRLKTLGTV